MHTCTKLYSDLPAAHRAPKHDGHCRLIHGHNFAFEIEFKAERPDENGFVVDFGKLKGLKLRLEYLFDHTCLIDKDDPAMPVFEDLNLKGLLDLRVVSGTSAEAFAALVAKEAQMLLNHDQDFSIRGAMVSKVICYEDGKNWATWS